jgi:hypothetical protein
LALIPNEIRNGILFSIMLTAFSLISGIISTLFADDLHDANVCRIIDNIINKNIQYPNVNFESVRVNIENEILKLPIKQKMKYVGF